VYIGLIDRAGRQLLIDWRTPAAEPFFGATHANPMGLTRRRRYRWSSGSANGARVSDYWDEVFTPDGLKDTASLDDQSAFIASLGTNRSAKMRDVLGTIVPEGAVAGAETDPQVARLKASVDMVRAIETAVRFYEEPPSTAMTVTTDWAEAFDTPEPGTPHNLAREAIWEVLVNDPAGQVRR
jgi:hypothetical protein